MFLPALVQLGYIKINQLDAVSRLSFGTNRQVAICNCARKTQGFGQQASDGTIVVIPITSIDDRDAADSESFDFNGFSR